MSLALGVNNIEKHEFFADYPAIWQQLKPNIRTHTHQKSDYVFNHGDAAQALWFVHKGWVKLVRQTPDGKETVIGICTEGDIFGEAAMFPNASYPYTAEVLDNGTEIYSVSSDIMRGALQKDQGFASVIMSMLNERIRQTQLKLEHMSTMSAAQRLGCFLLRLCKTSSSGSRILEIPVEKHVLAAYLGMKPETLSRSQQNLKSVGIQVNGSRVEVQSVQELRKFVCESCSESGSCETED